MRQVIFSRRPGACSTLAVLLPLLVVLFHVDGAAAQQTKDESAALKRNPATRYEVRARHDPNGIGKFYMDREIAHVMGYLAAPWLERPEREDEEKLSVLVDSLGLKPGMVVADVGAGSGVISLMIADRIGPKGKVLAVDVQEEMLVLLQKKLDQLKIQNVEPVKGTIRSPNLKENSVDLAIMVDVYHEFSHPYEMMLELSKAIKTGGRIVFVEYRREDPEVRQKIKLIHTMAEAQVKREMSPPELRLKWKETLDSLPMQHMIVFEKQAPQTPPR